MYCRYWLVLLNGPCFILFIFKRSWTTHLILKCSIFSNTFTNAPIHYILHWSFAALFRNGILPRSERVLGVDELPVQRRIKYSIQIKSDVIGIMQSIFIFFRHNKQHNFWFTIVFLGKLRYWINQFLLEIVLIEDIFMLFGDVLLYESICNSERLVIIVRGAFNAFHSLHVDIHIFKSNNKLYNIIINYLVYNIL